jgi:hypothetical protein
MSVIELNRGPDPSATGDVTRRAGPARSPIWSRARVFLAKNLEGWQPGVFAIFIAGVVAVLVVPRPVEPDLIPEPRFDHRKVERAAARDRELAKLARSRKLDTEVRALGDAIRAYGQIDYEADADRIREAKTAVARATARASAIDFGGVVELRAYETEAFIASLARFGRDGVIDDDLAELGGGYLRSLRKNLLGEGHDAEVDDDRIRAIIRTRGEQFEVNARIAFKRRWNELTGVGGQPGKPSELDPSNDELLAVYADELRHPPALGIDVDAKDGKTLAVRAKDVAAFRRRRIAAIAAIDSTYPRELALGVVNYQAGDYREASRNFTSWLEQHDDGPWALRAHGYALAAAARQNEGP